MNKKNVKKIITIGFLGNVLEWYDFSVYAFLAPVIGKVFFYADDPKVGLLKTFLVFSLSFFARPLGSIFFGSLGDRKGRAYSLKISLFLMGVPTIFIGLLPGYGSFGFISVFFLVVLRLIQGFAAGGEMPGNACYVYETADEKNRTFFCSFVAASGVLGVLSGSVVATLSFFIFSEAEMIDWAWRIPFLLGSGILIFLYYIRNKLVDECFVREPGNPLTKLIKKEYVSVFKVVVLYAFVQVSFYLFFVWMPSYLKVYLGYSSKTAFLLGSIGIGFLVIFTLFFGYIAKYVGRKRLILFGIISMLLLSYPAFLVLKYKFLPLVLLVIFSFALVKAAMDSVMVELMGDLFSKGVRCSGTSISFAIAALFGGIAPTICGYLINKTGYVFSPLFFLLFVGLIAMFVAFTVKSKGGV